MSKLGKATPERISQAVLEPIGDGTLAIPEPGNGIPADELFHPELARPAGDKLFLTDKEMSLIPEILEVPDNAEYLGHIEGEHGISESFLYRVNGQVVQIAAIDFVDMHDI